MPDLAGLPLTAVERRVIALTASGMTIAQIADDLGMTDRTAKRLRGRIAEKLGAANASEAVAIWIGREAIMRDRNLVLPGSTVLKTSFVSAVLGLSRDVVTKIDPERLPFYRVNERGDRRYRAADVARYIEDRGS